MTKEILSSQLHNSFHWFGCNPWQKSLQLDELMICRNTASTIEAVPHCVLLATHCSLKACLAADHDCIPWCRFPQEIRMRVDSLHCSLARQCFGVGFSYEHRVCSGWCSYSPNVSPRVQQVHFHTLKEMMRLKLLHGYVANLWQEKTTDMSLSPRYHPDAGPNGLAQERTAHKG